MGVAALAFVALLCMSLLVLLQVLGSFERFTTSSASMWFEWNMHTNMTGDVISFDCGCVTVGPATDELQVVGTLAANVNATNVFIEFFCRTEALRAALPLTFLAVRSSVDQVGDQPRDGRW